VADESVVFDRDSFTDEGVTGNLAVLANCGILLNFHECPDFGVVSNFATIEVDELG
jgi:hypothetical protein